MQHIKNPKYYVDTIQYLLALQSKTGKPNISFGGPLFANSKDAASLFTLNPSKIFMIPFNENVWEEAVYPPLEGYHSWSIDGHIDFTDEDGNGGIPASYFTPMANYLRKNIKINADGELEDSGTLEDKLFYVPNVNYVAFLGHNFRTTQSYPIITFETQKVLLDGDTYTLDTKEYIVTSPTDNGRFVQNINYPKGTPSVDDFSDYITFPFDNFSLMHWDGIQEDDEFISKIKIRIQTGVFNTDAPDWHSKLGTKIYIGSISLGTSFILPKQLAPETPLHIEPEHIYAEPPFHDADADVKFSIINKNKTNNSRTGSTSSKYPNQAYTYTGLSASCFDLLETYPTDFNAEDIFHKQYPLKKHTSFVPDGVYNHNGTEITYNNKWLGNQDRSKFRRFGRRKWDIAYSNVPFNFLYPLSDSSQSRTDPANVSGHGINKLVEPSTSIAREKTNTFSHYNFYSMVFSRTLGSQLPFIFFTQAAVHREDMETYSNYVPDQFAICKLDFSEYGVTRENFVDFTDDNNYSVTGLGKLELSIEEL